MKAEHRASNRITFIDKVLKVWALKLALLEHNRPKNCTEFSVLDVGGSESRFTEDPSTILFTCNY